MKSLFDEKRLAEHRARFFEIPDEIKTKYSRTKEQRLQDQRVVRRQFNNLSLREKNRARRMSGPVNFAYHI